MNAPDFLVAYELRKLGIRLNFENKVIQAALVTRPTAPSVAAIESDSQTNSSATTASTTIIAIIVACIIQPPSCRTICYRQRQSLFGDLPSRAMLPIPFGERVRRIRRKDGLRPRSLAKREEGE